MIISSKNLLRYVPAITFPVDILAEKDDRVMVRASREQLLALIAANGVIGIGSRNRIKRLRVNRVDVPTVEQKAVRKEILAARCSRGDLNYANYTYREHMENQPYTLKRVGDGGRFEHWADDEGFAPGRFNPDAIAAPLIPSKALL
jgi:hypothetical protein